MNIQRRLGRLSRAMGGTEVSIEVAGNATDTNPVVWKVFALVDGEVVTLATGDTTREAMNFAEIKMRTILAPRLIPPTP